jgi:hypothetical protein
MRNMLRITVACMTILCCSLAYGQSRDIVLTVMDGDTTATMHFGLVSGATDTIDAGLGETELPPLPPDGAFDARFIGTDIGIELKQGVVKDFRAGTTSSVGLRVHELRYQVGEGTSITIGWVLPADVTARLQDLVTGTMINTFMSGTGSFTVTNPGVLGKLKMIVHYKPVQVQLKVFLQGPYNTGAGAMNKGLNTAGVLATHFGAGKFPANAVDSINIEIRDSAAASKAVVRRYAPAWLLTDGTLRNFADTAMTPVSWDSIAAASYYIVVRHRNHLAVMSANAVALSTTSATYDLTTALSSAYSGGGDALKLVGTKYAMFAGNGNGDGTVNATDRNGVWRVQNGSINVYYTGDFNLDTYVNATDRNGFWRVNNGTLSQVP